jgi:hypothetical protein
MASVIRPGGPLDRFDRRECQRIAQQRFGRQRLIADHLRYYRTAIAEWAATRSAASA